MCRLHALEPAACEGMLPAAAHALLPQLTAVQEGVRLAAARCLGSVISTCLTDAAVSSAAQLAAAGLPRGSLPAAVSLVAAVADYLGPRYQTAWLHVLTGVAHHMSGSHPCLAPSLHQQTTRSAGACNPPASGSALESLLCQIKWQPQC